MLDLLNKGQITIRKVMGGWEKKSCKEGWQKKENLCKGEVKEKKSCRGNCTLRLTNCTCKKGTWPATLNCSFNFLNLVESPFTSFFLQLGKKTLSLSRPIYFVHSNLIMDIASQTSWPKKPLQITDNHGLKAWLCYKQPSCLIRLYLISKHILCLKSLDIQEWFHNWHV